MSIPAVIAIDLVLWALVRQRIESLYSVYLETAPVVTFIACVLQYAMLLIIATSVATDWRKRRLAIYCVLALVARLILEVGERGA